MSNLSLIILVAVMLVAPMALAQPDNFPMCVHELDACDPFINSTTAKPPVACCTPLQSVLKNELACLCGIFASRDLIQSLSLNVTEALTLPKRCGIDFDLNAECTALLAPAKAPASAMAPTAPTPGPAKSDAPSKIASIIGSVFGSFVVFTTLIFN